MVAELFTALSLLIKLKDGSIKKTTGKMKRYANTSANSEKLYANNQAKFVTAYFLYPFQSQNGKPFHQKTIFAL